MNGSRLVNKLLACRGLNIMIIAPCLTDKGEHTALYKINNSVYIKTSTTTKLIIFP